MQNESLHSGGKVRPFSGIFQVFLPENIASYATVDFIVAKNGGLNDKTAIH